MGQRPVSSLSYAGREHPLAQTSSTSGTKIGGRGRQNHRERQRMLRFFIHPDWWLRYWRQQLLPLLAALLLVSMRGGGIFSGADGLAVEPVVYGMRVWRLSPVPCGN